MVVVTRQTLDGAPQHTSTDVITFDGRDWNDSARDVLDGPGSSAAAVQSAVNRVVNGQAYDYFSAIDGTRWYHVTGPDAVASLRIPDPRQLLAELSPTARFAAVGHAVLHGVGRHENDRDRPGPPASAKLGGAMASRHDHITDDLGRLCWRRQAACGIEHRTGARGAGPAVAAKRSLLHLRRGAARLRVLGPQLIRVESTELVTYSGIGQAQVIRAPAGAITISSVG